MKTLRDYINVVLEADAPAAGNARERARAYRQRTANTSAPADQQPAGNAYDAVAGTPPVQEPVAQEPAPAAAPAPVAAPTPAPVATPTPSRGTYAQNGPVGDAVDAIKNWWNAPKPAQPAPATPVARTAPAPQGQGATPAVDPKVAALQKEIQSIQANIAASANDPRAVKDYNVQLYGAQSDLAKLTGQPAPAPVAGSTAAYGNQQIAKQGQQQQINKGEEELRVAQQQGDKAAADAAMKKIDQATTNKADITQADAANPYGTKSGKNLTPSTGPAPQAQAAAPTPAPAPAKPAAPVIPPAQLKKWQAVLNAEGYPTTPDGQWGPGTQKAVKDFQIANGLPATGQIDKTTSDALNSFAATPVAGSSQLRTTVTPAQESMSRNDKALLEKMLSIAGLR